MRPVLVEENLARYQLLASAVAGCAVRVERTLAGEPSYTDGHTIFLIESEGGRRADLFALAVQGALLAAGSLDPALLKRMVGRPSLARRYLAVEGWRALAELGERLPGVPVVASTRRAELWSSSPEESLAVAISRRPVPEAPEVFGVIRPRRVLAAGPAEEAGVPTAQDLARQQLTDEDIPTFNEDEETEDIRKIAKLFSSPFQSGLMRKLAKKMGIGKEPGSGVGGAELPHGGTRTTTRPGSKAALSLLPASLLPTEVLSERGFGWRYPEWDANARRYRPQWCTVIEVDPRPDDLKVFNAPPSTDLRRRLARLGVGLERHRRQPQGDDIDVDAAVESRVELLAGSTPDEGVYVESQRRKRSLAVLILLDISGSAAERATPRFSVHERQREAAAVMLDALHVLGDRVALYGFRSHGASAVYLVRVKGFEDVLNGLCMERLGGLVPGGYTRTGAAIRHSAHVLDTRAGTDRRLLVVLSDGFPYDDGYEGAYAEADARRALAETRRQGIGCLCLTLGASTDAEALKRVFGTAAHASAAGLEDLTLHIGPLFRRAMSSADLQRRLAQRTRRSELETTKGVA